MTNEAATTAGSIPLTRDQTRAVFGQVRAWSP